MLERLCRLPVKLFLIGIIILPAKGTPMQTTKVNIYSAFNIPVDLRSVITMPDLDISYALGTCLVKVGEDGLVVAGLAEKWIVDPNGQWIDFQLNSKALWSDGTPITLQNAIDSFADTKLHFAKEIPSLFEAYTSLELNGNLLRFHLKSGVTPAAFLLKLTEPMHALVKLVNGKATFKITSGPYTLKSQAENDLTLELNAKWIFFKPEMIREIHLRRPSQSISAITLVEDSWPDLVNIITGLPKTELKKLPPDLPVWKLNHDRLIHLRWAGRSSLESTRALLGYIRANADLTKVAAIVDGGEVATQIYAKGLVMHSKKEPAIAKITKEELAKHWHQNSLKIAYTADRMPAEIKLSVERQLSAIMPTKVEFVGLSGKDAFHAANNGQYDLIFASVGVDSINMDGGMSYYIEFAPAMFPSDDSEKGNFKARLKAVRQSGANPLDTYKQILEDVVEGNYFLPLVHCSTTVIGRKGLDFSQAPKVTEAIPFWALRRTP